MKRNDTLDGSTSISAALCGTIPVQGQAAGATASQLQAQQRRYFHPINWHAGRPRAATKQILRPVPPAPLLRGNPDARTDSARDH